MTAAAQFPPEIGRFIAEYFRAIDAGTAAIFAGAGLSAPAGFVDWRNLLRDIASELGLDVDRETDLVSLAQFHVNKYQGNRHQLNQAVIEALSAENPPTRNHRVMARLPIHTWWTTNYDQLIERALREAGKVVDVKYEVDQLANTRPRRDAIVYKMHGDVENANRAVVTRDDYERYTRDRGAFVNALAGDLVSKTFLFLGFSFTDPNLDQVLARVRLTYKENQRKHFAIFKRRTKGKNETEEEFAHARARQQLVIEDLRRYNIEALLVDDYKDITAILEELERRYRRRTVFVSSSAADFSPWGEENVVRFMRTLGDRLIGGGLRLATGLGLGVGNALFTGAVERVVKDGRHHIEDELIIRPFPQHIEPARRDAFWADYRRELIGNAGIALFLFGNKLSDGRIVSANGMTAEFDIAHDLGLVLLPIGGTGSAAAELAARTFADPNRFAAGLSAQMMEALRALATPIPDLDAAIDPLVTLIDQARALRS